MSEFTHLDSQGRACMVDIGDKPLSKRHAAAEATVSVSAKTIRQYREAGLPKGNPLEVARIAGIQAAKRTSALIPLCHTIDLDHIDVQITVQESSFQIRTEASCRWATGVEMEALTAASVAALTIYDMCKAVDKKIKIENIHLVGKTKK